LEAEFSEQTRRRATVNDKATVVVKKYIKLWPREVFYVRGDCLELVKEALEPPGVYILYQDFEVFYIGQTNCPFDRLYIHAAKRYELWNHFSAFVVPPEHLGDVEAIMIAATPRTANRSGGKLIEKIRLPAKVEKVLIESRLIPRIAP
jgi:hypothetical protein